MALLKPTLLPGPAKCAVVVRRNDTARSHGCAPPPWCSAVDALAADVAEETGMTATPTVTAKVWVVSW